MKILVIDNYDSFTYNLVHALKKLSTFEIDVKRNDQFEIEEARAYDKILLSPGPGIPSEGGKMPELLRELAPEKSILGICLGHQAIAENFGAKLINMPKVLHGIATDVNAISNEKLFKDIASPFQVGRYHSWLVDDKDLPDCIEVTCRDEKGQIMAIRHKEYDVCGMQFHPESVLTPEGEKMLINWLYE